MPVGVERNAQPSKVAQDLLALPIPFTKRSAALSQQPPHHGPPLGLVAVAVLVPDLLDLLHEPHPLGVITDEVAFLQVQDQL